MAEYTYGIQLYSRVPVDLANLAELICPTPYESQPVTEALLQGGVVFYRDSEHTQGAFSVDTFKGWGYYTQLYAHEDTGEILSVVWDNFPCHINWVKPDAVNSDRTNWQIKYFLEYKKLLDKITNPEPEHKAECRKIAFSIITREIVAAKRGQDMAEVVG